MTHLWHFSGERFRNALFEVAENHVWKTCGFYKGPGVNRQIIFMICNETVRGHVVKITLKFETALTVCEVEVFEKI
jgi:hypothetical protein